MSASSRTKGQSGEREVAALLADLTGLQVKRRVRQHDGDSDLEGVPGWSVEVKRHARAPRASVRSWWAQAVAQAARTGCVPVLLYRADRDEWRAVWPLSCLLVEQHAATWIGYAWTVEGTVQAWAAVFRETVQTVAMPQEGRVLAHNPMFPLSLQGKYPLGLPDGLPEPAHRGANPQKVSP
jgi:hypothetical protein